MCSYDNELIIPPFIYLHQLQFTYFYGFEVSQKSKMSEETSTSKTEPPEQKEEDLKEKNVSSSDSLPTTTPSEKEEKKKTDKKESKSGKDLRRSTIYRRYFLNTFISQ